jgi:hypothetical protein
MATSYSQRYGRPIGVNNRGFGGAGLNLGIEALTGETEMITVFDDFNDVLKGSDTFGGSAIFEDHGWVLTDDVGGSSVAGDAIILNDPSNVSVYAPSCLYLHPGTTADTGGNMQLDLLNGAIGTQVGNARFPHLWIPETAAGVTVLDNTVWVFACRLGFRADLTTTSSGDWDGKFFIGWAEAGDTSLMTHTDGLITITSGGPLVGFHAREDGSLHGVSHRTPATAIAEGTNDETILAAGSLDGTVANGAVTAGDTMWFDVALRMDITDMSDDAANGTTRFYYRKVRDISSGAPGRRDGRLAGDGPGGWVQHGTPLENQTPNNDVALVPTIEILDGPTTDTDCVVMIDWWCFATSRYSLNLSS